MNQRELLPVTFPCLLWEPSLGTIILATEMGTATVLKAGNSCVLRPGMVIPFGASRWCHAGEEWDFIIPPPELRVTLRNLVNVANRPLQLSVGVEQAKP